MGRYDRCDNQYFHNTCCEFSIEYFIAYSFFLVFNMFGYFLIIFNVFNFNYGPNSNTIKFIFAFTWFLFSCFFSRIFCIKKIGTSEEEIPLFKSEFTVL